MTFQKKIKILNRALAFNVSSYICLKAGRKGIYIISTIICSHIFIDSTSYFSVARMKNNSTFKGLAKVIDSVNVKYVFHSFLRKFAGCTVKKGLLVF